MRSQIDLAVFAKDYPEARLVVEIKHAFPSANLDAAAKELARHMWGSNCHFGLIVTPTQTHILRDDFTGTGPDAIGITETLPTAKVFGRLDRALSSASSEHELEAVVREWLQRLADSYETALPDDPAVTRAFFPDIVGAVSGGRVVSGAAA
jgi:hypothetical protein